LHIKNSAGHWADCHIDNAISASGNQRAVGIVMYSSRQHNRESPEVLKLREECGAWLKQLREEVGLSQREVAEKLGFEYYSFISQIETGRGRIPTHQIKEWARILDVPARDFARNLLRYYDPMNYDVLFGEDETAEAVAVPRRTGDAGPLSEDVAAESAAAPHFFGVSEPSVPDTSLPKKSPEKPPQQKNPVDNVHQLNKRIELLEQKALERRIKRLEELLKSESLS
jgi:transcriptional regulator with XRE-family HTH domain